MAHFFGEIFGQRRTVSTIGSKNSGISAHIRGWDSGVYIKIEHIDGKDVTKVYKTKGSNEGLQNAELICRFDNDGLIII